VFGHLSKEAQKVWDEIQFWGENKVSSEKVEGVLVGQQKRLRQELFIHALVRQNFDLSSACAMVHLSASTIARWKYTDLEFRQLVEEIEWHKKNFFERALVDLVEERNPAVVIFANRTKNADRGYNEKVSVEHSGRVDVGLIDIDSLDLDLETRRKILTAMERHQQTSTRQEPIDVEVGQLTS
jgi:Zn ribbon nucleic-acid-binding protein